MSTARAAVLLQYLRQLAAGTDADPQSDRELERRYATQRDEAAFAALVRRHGPMVLSVCRRVLHRPQDAEDAFQATFLVLLRKAGSIRRGESLGPWLYGVAYRVARKAQAGAARRRALLPRPAGVTSPDPGDEAARREEIQRMLGGQEFLSAVQSDQ